MSAPFIVPFNNQPTAVSVKTGSYTIPAGKYARVVVNLEGSATFTINGATALRGTQNVILSGAALSQEAQNETGGGGSRQYNKLLTGTIVQTAGSIDLRSNVLSFGTNDQKTLTETLWLPTGTVINGTGTWRAVVMEYNQIT